MAIENTDKETKYLRGAESGPIQETYPPCGSGEVEASQRVFPPLVCFRTTMDPSLLCISYFSLSQRECLAIAYWGRGKRHE